MKDLLKKLELELELISDAELQKRVDHVNTLKIAGPTIDQYLNRAQ